MITDAQVVALYRALGKWYGEDFDQNFAEMGKEEKADLMASGRAALEAAERAPQEPCSARVELAQAVERLAHKARCAGRYEDATTLDAAVRCIDTGEDPEEP